MRRPHGTERFVTLIAFTLIAGGALAAGQSIVFDPDADPVASFPGNVEIPNGNLGVGTSPLYPTHISGSNSGSNPFATLMVDENSNHGGVVINSPAGVQSHLRFQDAGNLKWQWRTGQNVGSGNGGDLGAYSWDQSNTILRLKNDTGNVEIPNGNLDLGSGSNNGVVYFTDASSWTGNAGSGEGKIEYHSGRFYINSGDSGNPIVHFRNSGGSNVMDVENNGNLDMHNNQITSLNQLNFNGGAWIDEGTAQYGSVRLDGGEEGGYGGISINANRDVVIGMTDADGTGFSTGVYDDSNNDWIWHYDGSSMDLRYNGGWKAQAEAYGLNINVDDSSDSDGLRLDGNTALTADPSDNWLRLNQDEHFSNGVYTPNSIRADDGFQVDGNTIISGGGGLNARGNLDMNGNNIREAGPYEDCRDILEKGASTGDGYYTIDPDGYAGGSSFQVYCDMTTDGGGWTLMTASSGDPPANLFITTSGNRDPASGNVYTDMTIAEGDWYDHIRWGPANARSTNWADVDYPVYNPQSPGTTTWYKCVGQGCPNFSPRISFKCSWSARYRALSYTNSFYNSNSFPSNNWNIPNYGESGNGWEGALPGIRLDDGSTLSDTHNMRGLDCNPTDVRDPRIQVWVR